MDATSREPENPLACVHRGRAVYGAPYARRDREGSAARQGGERGATGRGARRDREGSAARQGGERGATGRGARRGREGNPICARWGAGVCVCVRAQVWGRVRAGVQAYV